MIGEYIMKQLTLNKAVKTSIVLYAVALLIQFLYFLPFNTITTFVSQQNVPHTEVTDFGYDTIFEINNSGHHNGNIYSYKKINYTQVFFQFIITTAIAFAAYMIMKDSKYNKSTEQELDKAKQRIATLEKQKKALSDIAADSELMKMISGYIIEPTLDVNALAFADEETVNATVDKFKNDMKLHIMYKIFSEHKEIEQTSLFNAEQLSLFD